jgi:hypothetical protein
MSVMASTLRVDPARLVAAAAAEGDVGKSVSMMAAGSTLSAAAGGVPDLLTGAALQIAASAIDNVSAMINEELTSHADKLTAAAETYRRADDDLGRRLDHITGVI